MNPIISGTSFPAIRGIQSGHEYYIVMCPLKRLKKVFTFDEGALPVEARAQRSLNTDRIPEITNYILSQRDNYVFSAITACIDGDSTFSPIGEQPHEQKIGSLIIDEDADVFITDGQHRNAAILEALEQDPTLATETISVVFFAQKTLEDRQKIFKDLNLYPVKTDRSLSITYDDRPSSILSKTVIYNSVKLSKLVHMEESNLGPRSKKLLTHSALNKATSELFEDITQENYKRLLPLATQFWETIINNLPVWMFVYKDEMSARDVRKDCINAHSVTLQALGMVGKQLIKSNCNLNKELKKLKKINWDRNNKTDWEGRCVVNGAMRNSSVAAKLTMIRIKHYLGLPLTPKEQIEENRFLEARNGNK